MHEKLILEKIRRVRPTFERATIFSNLCDVSILRILSVCAVGHR